LVSRVGCRQQHVDAGGGERNIGSAVGSLEQLVVGVGCGIRGDWVRGVPLWFA
jgi:hypothetical protein